MKDLNTNNNVALIRRRHGISRDRLASSLGWSSEYLYEYERDAGNPNSSLVIELVGAFKGFGIDVDALDIFINFPPVESLAAGEQNKLKAILDRQGIGSTIFAKALGVNEEHYQQAVAQEIDPRSWTARKMVLALRKFGVYMNEENVAGVRL